MMQCMRLAMCTAAHRTVKYLVVSQWLGPPISSVACMIEGSSDACTISEVDKVLGDAAIHENHEMQMLKGS